MNYDNTQEYSTGSGEDNIEQDDSNISMEDQDNIPIPDANMISELFSTMARLEINRHFHNISIDYVEYNLRRLDALITSCEQYYSGLYANNFPMFFVIIKNAKDFVTFIRDDQDRGLPPVREEQ